MKAFDNLSVGNKISISVSIAISLIFMVGMGLFAAYESKAIRQKIEENIKTEIDSVTKSLERFENMAERSGSNADLFLQSKYPGKWSVDRSQEVQVGEYKIHSLINNGKNAVLDNTPPDEFTKAIPGSFATIFYKLPNGEYLRTATSLMDEKGKRSYGTVLHKDHPGIPFFDKGEIYVGLAKLFGKQYFTKYVPITVDGKVVGVTVAGLLLDDQMKELKNDILSKRFGKTGYVYALDTKGILQINPDGEGKNVADSKDSSGHMFIREMIQNKNGTIAYPWMNPGETKPREKIVAYKHFQKWDWIIGGGAYIDELDNEMWTLLKVSALIGLVTVVFLSLIVHILAKRIFSPVVQMLPVIESVASGDLNVELKKLESQDEIGRLNKAFVSMLEKLRNAVSVIHSSADAVSSVAEQIDVSSTELNKSSQVQAEATSSMAAAVEELTVSIGQIAEQAEQAGRISRETSELSKQDQVTVGSMNREMQEIASNMEFSSREVEELNALSSKIGTILQVIKDVADQTNLLALNAAIEAARAGEYGRGFAVVADEVRKLAERTGNATGEISQMILSIQQGVNNTNQTIRSGMAQVLSGSQNASRMKDSLEQTVKGTLATQDGVQIIVDATTEQRAAANDIARNVEHIASMSEQNTAATGQITSSASHLSSLATNLKQAVSVFRI